MEAFPGRREVLNKKPWIYGRESNGVLRRRVHEFITAVENEGIGRGSGCRAPQTFHAKLGRVNAGTHACRSAKTLRFSVQCPTDPVAANILYFWHKNQVEFSASVQNNMENKQAVANSGKYYTLISALA